MRERQRAKARDFMKGPVIVLVFTRSASQSRAWISGGAILMDLRH
jgi:hypothetical protein